MKRILAAISLMIFTSGCTTAPLTEDEMSIRIYKRSDPPSNCKEIGPVIAKSIWVMPDDQEGLLKKAVKEKGGNAVSLEGQDATHIKGKAFNCPKN